jgi:hypothetical protein
MVTGCSAAAMVKPTGRTAAWDLVADQWISERDSLFLFPD